MSVRRIEVRERVMARNDEIAAEVRALLDVSGVAAINLVSSPGAGKTMLLERTLDDVGRELRLAIVTGDVQTANDADRLAAHTSRLVQAVVTNGGCHLDALQVTRRWTRSRSKTPICCCWRMSAISCVRPAGTWVSTIA